MKEQTAIMTYFLLIFSSLFFRIVSHKTNPQLIIPANHEALLKLTASTMIETTKYTNDNIITTLLIKRFSLHSEFIRNA